MKLLSEDDKYMSMEYNCKNMPRWPRDRGEKSYHVQNEKTYTQQGLDIFMDQKGEASLPLSTPPLWICHQHLG